MMKFIIVLSAAVAILTTNPGTQADSIAFREGGGTGFVDVTFDDLWIRASTDTGSNAGELVSNSKYNYWSLLGIKDLFSQIPKNNGSDTIVFDSALLSLCCSTNAGGNTTFYRVTSDWMTEAPSLSESDTSGNERDMDADLTWAAGGFSNADYDAANGILHAWPADNKWNYHDFDITDIVADIYDTEINYGIAWLTYESDTRAYSSESSHTTRRPILSVEYHYEPIPEPASMTLIALGGLAILRRRRSN